MAYRVFLEHSRMPTPKEVKPINARRLSTRFGDWGFQGLKLEKKQWFG
jgi:hypothetical protein